MGTNHLGHAALIAAAWPQLTAARGRVVVLCSISARGGRLSARTTREQLVAPRPYLPFAVYANTKQANLLFAQELHRRAVATGSPVSVVAAHPGVSATNLFTSMLPSFGRSLLEPVGHAVVRMTTQPAAEGALSTLRALDPGTPGGAFVGPNRLGQSRGRPELLTLYPNTRDTAAAARLWELSEEILGTRFPV
jgi:NAD(P)-dependent dehydrogenase (short-subunit alcohol dehydrogenase family)